MLKIYALDENGYIGMTTDVVTGEEENTFEFPNDFDFGEQRFYKIVDGELVEDTEKREAEAESQMEHRREAERMEAQVLYTAMMTDTLLEE